MLYAGEGWESQASYSPHYCNMRIIPTDSFKGRESAVVIVDTVAAKDGLRKSRQEIPEILDDAETVGTQDYTKVGAVT